MLGIHIVDYTMPLLGYQDYLLPKKLHEMGFDTMIITSDRFTPVSNYESSWGPIMGERICGGGDEIHEGFVIRRLSPVFELQRRILLKGLYNELAKLKPQYIFVHNIVSMNVPIAIKYGKNFNVPVFIDSHLTHTSTNTSLLGKLYYRLIRNYYRRNKGYVTEFFGVAEECRDHMEKYLGITNSVSKLLPIGIDENIFHYSEVDRRQIRYDLGVKDEEILLMQTGKLSADKGVHMLPPVIAGLSDEIKEKLKVVLVGDGDKSYLKTSLHDPLKAVGFDSYVITGFVDYRNLPKYFSAADVVVYPQASSLSALEAAACRNIVLMSNTDASKWRADKGVGISLDFSNSKKVSGTINALLNVNNRDLEIRKQKAAEAVHLQFSYNAIGKDFMNSLNN